MENKIFVILLRYTVDNEMIEHHLKEHNHFLDVNYAKEIFLASGAQHPRTGGVIFAKAQSREELSKLLEHDPFYCHHCAEYQIYEFNPTKYSSEFGQFMKDTGLRL